MEFRIAGTFTDSLARLNAEEQKQAKTTAFDLQVDPSSPGMSFHRLDKAKDKNFWSVRVNDDLRLIVHRTEESLLLCYVDHHEAAYTWAERRKLQTHPRTGAAQLVEVREMVREVVVPTYVQPSVFARYSDEDLLGYGVPLEWLSDVRAATNQSAVLALTDHLPEEAAEALLELAIGGTPRVSPRPAVGANPLDHPDAQRRFRLMPDIEELTRALDAPWEKWIVFLHPDQRQWVERDYSGPARVSGSAGTGKTILALHRAAFLARTDLDARVLLTTFSDPLANALRTKLKRLISNEPRLAERLEVHAIDAVGERLHKAHLGPARIAGHDVIRDLLGEASRAVEGHKFNMRFLMSEWEHVVDAWQLATWEDYRDVVRLGRKTRLPEAQRAILWAIFGRVLTGLADQGLVTRSGLFTRLASVDAIRANPPFDFAVVDEAQDVSVAQLRFLAALGGGRPNALFFAGDLGQRIFQQPFSWKALGVDVRGRCRTLRVNYRTSHQIRMQADLLLAPEVSDVDGNCDRRADTVSAFNGPPPAVRVFDSEEEETEAVGAWIAELAQAGVAPHEFGVFVRSMRELHRARAAAEKAGIPAKVLDERVATTSGYAAIGTMHLAKGLEFRAVAVMACDDEVIPLQERIETVGDDADLQEVYDTERHLLYVACTRARDHLMITGVEPASEFLDDLREWGARQGE